VICSGDLLFISLFTTCDLYAVIYISIFHYLSFVHSSGISHISLTFDSMIKTQLHDDFEVEDNFYENILFTSFNY
jgi:hypothetical protein